MVAEGIDQRGDNLSTPERPAAQPGSHSLLLLSVCAPYGWPVHTAMGVCMGHPYGGTSCPAAGRALPGYGRALVRVGTGAGRSSHWGWVRGL
jgi:hypothetical protein